jgi:hypothetical protein
LLLLLLLLLLLWLVDQDSFFAVAATIPGNIAALYMLDKYGR